MTLAFVEGFKGLVGWGFLIFFFLKYSKLNKLNANHQDVKVDASVTIANGEVRQSVVV